MNSRDYFQFLILLFFIDMIWISQPFHKKLYEQVQNSTLVVDKKAVALFYLLAPLAFIYFIRPLSKTKKDALFYGVIMGFLMYMTYDLTNKAVFREYTWDYAINDVIWGSVVFGVVSYLIY